MDYIIIIFINRDQFSSLEKCMVYFKFSFFRITVVRIIQITVKYYPYAYILKTFNKDT